MKKLLNWDGRFEQLDMKQVAILYSTMNVQNNVIALFWDTFEKNVDLQEDMNNNIVQNEEEVPAAPNQDLINDENDELSQGENNEGMVIDRNDNDLSDFAQMPKKISLPDSNLFTIYPHIVNDNRYDAQTVLDSTIPPMKSYHSFTIVIPKNNISNNDCSSSSRAHSASSVLKLFEMLQLPDADNQIQIHYPVDFIKEKLVLPLHSPQSVGDLLAWKNSLLFFQQNTPSKISYWMFTPSYIGLSRLKDKLLDRTKCFPRCQAGKDFIEILVVRKNQYDLYCEHFRHSHIIVSMPEKMCIPLEERKQGYECVYEASVGRIGYARRFIQYFAECLELPAVWMLDDNILRCYQLDISEESKAVKPTSFLNIIQHLEAVLDGKETEIITNDLVACVGRKSWEDGEEWGLIRSADDQELQLQNENENKDRHIKSPRVAGIKRKLDTSIQRNYTGPRNAYGILGMGRSLTRYQEKITHSINVTHSIYSFFLLNIEVTKAHKLYYPCKAVWEDIEMLNMMDERGIAVCKFQLYSHYKPPHGLLQQSLQEAQSIALTKSPLDR